MGAIALVLFLLLGTVWAQGQSRREEVPSRRVRFNQLMNQVPESNQGGKRFSKPGDAHIYRNKEGFVNLMSAPRGESFPVTGIKGDRPEENGRRFLKQWQELFTDSSDDLDFNKSKKIGFQGRDYIRYQQTFQGIEILRANVVVVIGRDGGVEYVGSGLMRELEWFESDPEALHATVRVDRAKQIVRQWMKRNHPEAKFYPRLYPASDLCSPSL